MNKQMKFRKNGLGEKSRKINVDSIYQRMKKVIDERVKLQTQQKRLWKVIQSNNCDRSSKMNEITKLIGSKTHELNNLINELCRFKKTHRAMNLAQNYLEKEIIRINKIIDSQKNTINEVNRGYACLINSAGVSHCDTRHLEHYIEVKQTQANKLKKWQSIVSRYTVPSIN